MLRSERRSGRGRALALVALSALVRAVASDSLRAQATAAGSEQASVAGLVRAWGGARALGSVPELGLSWAAATAWATEQAWARAKGAALEQARVLAWEGMKAAGRAPVWAQTSASEMAARSAAG